MEVARLGGVVVLVGGAVLEVGGERFDLGTGDWVLLRAHEIHRLIENPARNELACAARP